MVLVGLSELCTATKFDTLRALNQKVKVKITPPIQKKRIDTRLVKTRMKKRLKKVARRIPVSKSLRKRRRPSPSPQIGLSEPMHAL